VSVATGRYIGGKFDRARLDTLSITLPVSWRGMVEQDRRRHPQLGAAVRHRGREPATPCGRGSLPACPAQRHTPTACLWNRATSCSATWPRTSPRISTASSTPYSASSLGVSVRNQRPEIDSLWWREEGKKKAKPPENDVKCDRNRLKLQELQ